MNSYRQTSVVRTLVFTFCWQWRLSWWGQNQTYMDNIWRHNYKKTPQWKVKKESQKSKNPKGQFLNHDLPPSKAITHNYDSNGKEKKTRKTNEAEMDGRNHDLKNKQNENIFIDIQQTCSIKHICGWKVAAFRPNSCKDISFGLLGKWKFKRWHLLKKIANKCNVKLASPSQWERRKSEVFPNAAYLMLCAHVSQLLCCRTTSNFWIH